MDERNEISQNDRQILQLLLNQQLTITELSSLLNVHHSTIQYHLQKLESLNLIINIPKEQPIKYIFHQNRRVAFTEFLEKYSN
ncbi:MAG TPA: ArsR family transcriptional regulator [Candidatus Deferrimicrobium sp.]|nr:ArsR family transcriptional regulator [Candidatus Deferrimicrobium sp.]